MASESPSSAVLLGIASFSLVCCSACVSVLFRRLRLSVSDLLFFTLSLSDWWFVLLSVVDNAFRIAQPNSSPTAIVIHGVYRMGLFTHLVGNVGIATFILMRCTPKFHIKLFWTGLWTLGLVYSVLTTKLQAQFMDSDNTMQEAKETVLGIVARSYLAAMFAITCGSVLLTLFSMTLQQKIFSVQGRITRHLLWTTALHLPLVVLTIKYGVLFADHELSIVLKLVPQVLVYLVPIWNAFTYGLRPILTYLCMRITGASASNGVPSAAKAPNGAQINNGYTSLVEFDGLSDVECIGEGAAGVVYKCRWLGIDVALKVIRPPQTGENDDLDLYQTFIKDAENAFLEEAEMCARLRHPHITLFLQVGYYGSKLGIISEYCARGSLKDVLRESSLPWPQKLMLASHVAQGLVYLHARNPTYIHRDLKASNILVTENWQAKLADFGISKVIDVVHRGQAEKAKGSTNVSNLTSVFRTAYGADGTGFAGTWRWNAPEILQDAGKCIYTRASDVYSFGMVLWELCTDARTIPFEHLNFDFQVREAVLGGDRPPIPSCPPSAPSDKIIGLLKECWSQDPKKRPSASNVAERLQTCIDNLSLTNRRMIPNNSLLYSMSNRRTELSQLLESELQSEHSNAGRRRALSSARNQSNAYNSGRGSAVGNRLSLWFRRKSSESKEDNSYWREIHSIESNQRSPSDSTRHIAMLKEESSGSSDDVADDDSVVDGLAVYTGRAMSPIVEMDSTEDLEASDHVATAEDDSSGDLLSADTTRGKSKLYL